MMRTTCALMGCFAVSAVAHGLTVGMTPDTFLADSGFLRNGGDAQFAGGNLRVDGATYTPGAAGALPTFTTGLETVGGLDITGRIDLFGDNGTTTASTLVPNTQDYVYARQIYLFTNNTAATINATVSAQYVLETGSDTSVEATSSGDTTVDPSDLWVVADDFLTDGGPPDFMGAGSTPAVGMLFADGLAQLPSNVDRGGFNIFFADFNLAVAPGETQAIMIFAASRNATDTHPNTASRAETEQDMLDILADPEAQFAGLSAEESAAVINFVPAPGTLAIVALAGVAATRRRR